MSLSPRQHPFPPCSAAAGQGDTLLLTLRNDGAAPADAQVTMLAYGGAAPATHTVGAGESVVLALALAAQRNWYDVKVQAGSGSWRFAGRIENGRDGVAIPRWALLRPAQTYS